MTNRLRSTAVSDRQGVNASPRPGFGWLAVAVTVALLASVLAVISLQSSASGQRQDAPSFVTAAGDEVMLGQSSYQVRMAGQDLSRSLPVTDGVYFGGRNLKAAGQAAGSDSSGLAYDSLSPAEESKLWLLQFATVPLPAYRAELEQLGAVVGPYVPEHAHIVRMDPAAVSTIEGLPYVRWIGRYTADLKVAAATADAFAATPDQVASFRIRLFDTSAATKTSVAAAVEAAGGQVITGMDAGAISITATMSFAAAAGLLSNDGVQYLEPITEAESDTFVERLVGGANRLETSFGYTGDNVGIHVFDDGVVAAHEQLTGIDLLVESNPTNLVPGTNGNSSHGTSSTSIIAGNGAGNGGARGIAPDARVTFSTYLPLNGSPVATSRDRLALSTLLVDPAQAYRAVVSVSPWGSELGNEYTIASADLDNATFQTDLLTIQSQGNGADDTAIPEFRPQASAKNVVSVGGVSMFGTADRGDDLYRNVALTSSSGPAWASIGPTEDGRVKPDLVFANDGTAAAAYRSEGVLNQYELFNGTSASSVAIAGFFGLLYEMWADGVFTGTPGLGRDVFDSRMRMATAKAIAINTAYQYDFQGTAADKSRYKQGWGHISLGTAADLALGGNMPIIIDETDLITPFGINSYEVGITASTDCKFRTTMVYTDPAGTPGAASDRINDLSLRLTSPSGATYWGNNGLTQSNQSIPGGTSNRFDTVENVFLANPEPGRWFIEVFGDEIVQDGHPETGALDADYALISSGECVGPAGPQPGAVVGSLWRDDNGDGSEGGTEPGLSGIQLQLLDPSNNIVASTATSSDGDYNFADVAVGTYTLLIVESTLPNDIAPTADPDGIATENRAAITVVEDTQVIANFGWQVQTMSLGNRIFEDTNFNGVLDANEGGIGTSITIGLVDGSGATVRSVQTDADGWFLFDRLQPGTYRLAIPGFEFRPGGELDEFDSTIGDADPNNNQDNDDNAAMYSGEGIQTQEITLALGNEPTGEDFGPLRPSAPDANTNLTIDIGLFPSRD